MTVVFETNDLGRFAIAKSLLQANGIEYRVLGEALQDINLLSGPAQLAVSDEDAETARELLADV